MSDKVNPGPAQSQTETLDFSELLMNQASMKPRSTEGTKPPRRDKHAMGK